MTATGYAAGALVAYIVMVVVNFLANAVPIAGRTSAQISDSYANLFAPAGFTFAIWGVIYILLGFHVAWQLGLGRPKQSAVSERAKVLVAKLFIASSALNAAWIVAWHDKIIWLSLVLILGMLLLVGKAAMVLADQKIGMREGVLTSLPFSVYFAWLTVATIANVTTWLVSVGWDGGGIRADIWTVGVLTFGFVIGAAITWRLRDGTYSAVLAWAYWGILAKHLPTGAWHGKYELVIGALAALVPLLVILTLTMFYTNFAKLKIDGSIRG
ncbi:MAG: hypothetical protein QG629_344 [Patescibacteria group bacterium]|nr:tryptophan-rich sensory protein [Candidatus Saccharibacteria bacterium]MDQ5963262.1 hypothetical protein [Patescibacteria group bacterium]